MTHEHEKCLWKRWNAVNLSCFNTNTLALSVLLTLSHTHDLLHLPLSHTHARTIYYKHEKKTFIKINFSSLCWLVFTSTLPHSVFFSHIFPSQRSRSNCTLNSSLLYTAINWHWFVCVHVRNEMYIISVVWFRVFTSKCVVSNYVCEKNTYTQHTGKLLTTIRQKNERK